MLVMCPIVIPLMNPRLFLRASRLSSAPALLNEWQFNSDYGSSGSEGDINTILDLNATSRVNQVPGSILMGQNTVRLKFSWARG